MLGKRLRELRKENNLTMKELGEKFNLAESTISGYENETRKPDMDTLGRFANFFGTTVDYLLGRSDIKIEGIKHFVNVPVLGSIAAGLPVYAEQNVIGYEKTPAEDVSDGEYFYLIVRGDSMIGSRIHDGDKVLVKVTTDISPKDIAVVLVNDQDATLKRVQKLNGHVVLMPDNPKYEPIVIDNGQVRIIGKVVEVKFKP